MHTRSVVLLALALALAGLWAFLRTPSASVSTRAPAVASTAAATPASTLQQPAPPAAPDPTAAQPIAPVAATASSTGSTPPPRRSVAEIFAAAGDMSDPVVRERAVATLQAMQEERRAAAMARAHELGLPVRTVGPRGRVREVYDLDEQGHLIYRTTLNLNAARSSGASLLQAETPPLTGSGVTVGIWDAGRVRTTHQELTGRVTLKDSATAIDDHSTHVGGTIGASGVVASAKGMAPAVSIYSYDWNSDYAEMTAAGATAAGQTTKIYLSNHSYGTVNGWDYTGETNPMWIWYGSGTGTTGADAGFGQYGADAADVDAVVYSTPYLLPFVAAGNDGTDDPVNGDKVQLNPDVSTTVTYSSATHPAGDGKYRGGYDTIASSSIGKNVLTVGAATDAVTGTERDITKAALVDFSSVGPTDDGRIKPDLVANGEDLYSSVGTSNTAYDTYSGTSMATPSAAGSAALLVQLYSQLFPNGAMRASTLKALLIHTADDLGTAGPDYKNGWGLINVKAAADLLREHAADSAKLRVNESQISTTTTTVTYDFIWDGTSPIRATLCWTDPAATSTTSLDSRTSRLVNNLDLKITGPDSSTHLPYVMPFVGTWTQPSMATAATRGVNNTDNVEQVYIATPPASGTYHAVVTFQGTLTNSVQNFSLIITGSTAEPPLPSAPTITTPPLARTVEVGSSVSLSVVATGTAPLSYQWRKNGTNIDGATSSTLTLANLQTTDSGSYDVVVTNSLGTATSNAATLTVTRFAPSILTHPVSQSAAIGGSVTFSVTASGTAPLTYQWRKNGQPINGATNATFTLTNAQNTDAGSYDVIVTNSVDSVTSNAATLTVVAVTNITWNFTTNADPSSVLPAGVTGGTISQGNSFGLTTLLSTSSASSGYTGASGTNNAGQTARIGALVMGANGSAYFEFTLTPLSGRRLVASGFTFGSRRTGSGPQAYALYTSVDNYTTPVSTGAFTVDTNWHLNTASFTTVTGAISTPITFRLYGYGNTGSTSPSSGTANWRIDDLALTVAVQTAPVITSSPSPQSVVAGANATFTVTATGTDPLSYQWRKNTQNITGATTASYTIIGAQTTDAGSYDVIVTNSAGTATSSAATLTVTLPVGFSSWLQSNFTEAEQADPQISGPNVVLTADGLTNLLKYALGLDPHVAATTGLPAAGTNGPNWTYTYTRPANRTDLTYTVQASTNLTDWTTLTPTTTKLGTAGGVETWQAEYPVANATQLFFRLKVTTNNPQ